MAAKYCNLTAFACREIGFRACSLLFCAKSCKKWHEIGCFCSVSSCVSYGIRIGAEKIYGRFGITICAFFLDFSVFSEFLAMFWNAGKEWGSRGRWFESSHSDQKSRGASALRLFRSVENGKSQRSLVCHPFAVAAKRRANGDIRRTAVPARSAALPLVRIQSLGPCRVFITDVSYEHSTYCFCGSAVRLGGVFVMGVSG